MPAPGAGGMPGQMGAPAGQAMPADPAQVRAAAMQLEQALAQTGDRAAAVAQVLSTGAPPEVVLAALAQLGVSPEEAQALVQQAMAMLQAGGMGPQGAPMSQANQPPPQTGGSGAIQAAPNVQAVPATPRPPAMAGAGGQHVGRVVKPSGVGSGRAPGVKREG